MHAGEENKRQEARYRRIIEVEQGRRYTRGGKEDGLEEDRRLRGRESIGENGGGIGIGREDYYRRGK